MRGGIAKIIPSVKLTLMLPADVALKLNLHLYSPERGRVPKSAYQKFFVELINEFFNRGPENATGNCRTNPDDL